MVDLDALVNLRDRRVSNARRQEEKAREKARAAHAELDTVLGKRDAFLDEIRTLETDLLSALMNTRVTVHDLTAVKAKLDAADRRVADMETAIETAQRAVADAVADHGAARQDTAHLTIRLEKSREMHRHLRDLDRHSRQAAEDTQLDEMSQVLTARRGF